MAHRTHLQYSLQNGSHGLASLTQRIEAIRTDSRDRASRIVNCGGRDLSDRRLAKTANLVFQTPQWPASHTHEPRQTMRRNYSTERQPAGRRSIASRVPVGELCKDNATRTTRSRGEARRRDLYDTKMGLRRSTISRIPATAPKSTSFPAHEDLPTKADAEAVRETPRPAIQRCDRLPTSVAAIDANLHYRSHMEDGHKLIDRLFSSKDDLWSFYGVYDGHGGRLVTDKCLAVLHELVLRQLVTLPGFPSPEPDAVRSALEKSFATMDEALRTKDAWHCGATCTVVLVHTGAGVRKMYVANVGDSRAVLVSNDRGRPCQSVRVSVDHRATDPEEIHRVQSAGGMISRGRVGGQLMLTRALGDFALKHVGVSHVPYTLCRNLKPDDAIIIASDGLWDVLSDGDSGRILTAAKAKHGNTKAVARALVESASSLGSTDNITCVVAFI